MFEEGNALLIYVNAAVSIHQKNKESVLKELIAITAENSSSPFKVEEVYKEVLEREELSTTGFGEGFAIPHGKSSDLSKPLVAVLKLTESVEWDSMDDEQVDTVILLIVPKENGESQHLKLLSTLSYNLMDKDVQLSLKEAKTDEGLYETVQMMLETN